MKRFNWLIPVCVSLIPISIVGCGKNGDGYNAIPKSYLNIQNTTLNGFDQNHQTAESLNGYDSLIIPKEITHLTSSCFNTDDETGYSAPNAIKKVDFEENCECSQYSNLELAGTNFNNCANLTIVVFPPKYNAKDQFMFDNCPKLSTFDLRNITTEIRSVFQYLPYSVDTFPANGEIIMRKDQDNVLAFAYNLRTKLESKGWKVVTK